MSPRGVPKDKTPVVVEEQPLEQTPNQQVAAQAQAEAEGDYSATSGKTEEQALQEFNEHIQSLVKNFVQQEVGERLEDLERLVTVLIGKTGAANDDASAAPYKPAEVGEPHYDVPDYKQEHQGGDGIGWYTG